MAAYSKPFEVPALGYCECLAVKVRWHPVKRLSDKDLPGTMNDGFLLIDRGKLVAKGFEGLVRVYELRWRGSWPLGSGANLWLC